MIGVQTCALPIFMIDSNDRISGTTSDSRFGVGTVQSGSKMATNGRLSLSVIYSAETPPVSTATGVQLTLGAGGVLSGTGHETETTTSSAVTITLTPAST